MHRPRRHCVGVLATGLTAAVMVMNGTAADAHTAPSLAQAKKDLLTLSNMPKGWTSSKSSNGGGSLPGTPQLASCLGISPGVVNASPPTANSPQFSSKNQLQSVSDSVSVYRSAKAAQADFASVADTKTPACLTTVLNGAAKVSLQKEVGAGATVGTIDVSRTPAADYAPHSANFTMFFPVTDMGVTLNAEVTVVDFVRGNREQTLTLTSLQSPFPAALSRHLTSVADAHL